MTGTRTALGKALRMARTARRLTMAQLADRAGISPVTLGRWESGRFQPRLPELDAVLTALDAAPPERSQILSFLDAPRALTRSPVADAADIDAAHSPVIGDLLRALRLRKRWSLDDAARTLGVAPRTVRRWENSESVIPEERFDAVCRALEAEPEERAALLRHRVRLWTPGRKAARTADDLEAHLLTLRDEIRSGTTSLIDLRLMTLKAELWSRGGDAMIQRLLAHAQLVHCEFLEARGRQPELTPLVNQALGIILQDERPDRMLLAQALHTQGAIGRGIGGRAQFERFHYLLRRWRNLSEDRLWLTGLYRDVAEAALEAGEKEASLEIIRQGTELVREKPDSVDWRLANHVQARILINLNRLDDAARLLPTGEYPNPYQRLYETYQRIELYQGMGENAAAQEWLRRAYRIIGDYRLGSGYADTLASQL